MTAIEEQGIRERLTLKLAELPPITDEMFIREHHVEHGVVQRQLIWRMNSMWIGRILVETAQGVRIGQPVELFLDHLPQGYRTVRRVEIPEEIVRDLMSH